MPPPPPPPPPTLIQSKNYFLKHQECVLKTSGEAKMQTFKIQLTLKIKFWPLLFERQEAGPDNGNEKLVCIASISSYKLINEENL